MKTGSNLFAPNKNSFRRGITSWAKLSYFQKFTIITMVFALPVLAFIPLAYEQYQRIDQYGTKEGQGVLYLRNLWDLSDSLHNYIIVNTNVENGSSDKTDLTRAKNNVTDALNALKENTEIEKNLGLSVTSQNLEDAWKSSQDSNNALQLSVTISNVIREVGDKSFLILDPDLDTYYLMDAILLRLPENQNNLYTIKQLTQKVDSGGKLTAEEYLQLQNGINIIQNNLEDVTKNLGVVAENNKNSVYSLALTENLDSYKSDFNAYSKEVLAYTSVNGSGSSTQISTLFTEVIQAEAVFYNVASTALEQGIQNRVNTYSFSIEFYSIVSILSILAAFTLGNQLLRSIIVPLQKTIEASEKFASGEFHTRIEYTTEDETGLIIQAFNKLAEEIDVKQKSLLLRSSALESKTSELETIAKVSREITSFRDLSSLLTASTNLIHENFGYYHVGIFLLDERKEFAVLAASNSEGGKRMLERGHHLKVGETGIVGYVSQALEARIALDVGKDAVFFNNPDLPETRSELALPLVVNTQILGILDVQSTQPEAFDQEDVKTLNILADQLAIAIQNANLFSEAEKAIEATRATYGQLSREAWNRILRSQARVGFLATPPSTIQIQSETLESNIAKAIETGDLIHDTDGLTISVPVKIRGQIIGAIRLKKSDISEAWTQDETNLAIALSDQLSGALESARLYRESQQRAYRESLVSDISARINASATRDLIIRETVQELGQSLVNASVTFQLLDQSLNENPANGNGRAAKSSRNE
ncbi:MAG: GAF domain-containing protein [Anaerolineales bacterium]